MLEIIGTIVGLLYLWLEYRASIYVWLAGFIMPAIYTVVYYQAGLYADCGINVYYIIAAVYGVIKWTAPLPAPPRGGEDTTEVTASPLGGKGEGAAIIHTPRHLWPALVASFLSLWLIISLVLIHLTDSTVPVTDAFTTALSIVAMYMLAHKHAEQWLAWMVVDAVCSGLYIYKELHFTAALYALYTVMAVAGYIKWTKLALTR